MEIKEITYAKILDENAKKIPDVVAVCSDGQSYTYKELCKITDVFAAKLIEKGIKKNEHIALWGFNSANWIIAFTSIIKAGAVAVLMNYSLPSKELKDLIDLTDSTHILFGNNRETLKDSEAAYKLAEMTNIKKENVINISGNEIDFKSFLNDKIDTSNVRKLVEEDDSHRDAVIIFTTGTTALPKAVLLSQFGIINDGNGYGEKYETVRGPSICNTLPLFHSFGLMVVTLYLHDGRSVYLHEIVKPEEIIKVVDTYKTTDMSGVGAVYSALVDHPDFDIKVIPHVRICLIGGSVSTPVFMMRLESKFKHSTFLNGYGQTESSPALTLVRPTDPIEQRATSVGSPLVNAEVKIWSKDKGFLPTGEIGEVVAKGYFLMNGYYKLPPEKQAIDKDGWLHTGDLGYFDDLNFLHLTGRIKDIIIKSGENISPVEIEQEIIKNEAVKEVKVMGAPHPVTGESIEACVVLYEGKTLDEDLLKAELRKNISKFKVPEHFFVFDSFPLSGNGKLDQRGLKKMMLARCAILNFEEQLEKGFKFATLTIGSFMINLSPIIYTIEKYASELGFSEIRVIQICKAVQGILSERIKHTYLEVGDINLTLKMFKNFFRIEIQDSGSQYFTDKNPYTGELAKVILTYVDKFSTTKDLKEQTVYNFDFNWEKDFDVKEFMINIESKKE